MKTTTKECPKCHRGIRPNNYKRHVNICNLENKQIEEEKIKFRESLKK